MVCDTPCTLLPGRLIPAFMPSLPGSVPLHPKQKKKGGQEAESPLNTKQKKKLGQLFHHESNVATPCVGSPATIGQRIMQLRHCLADFRHFAKT